jgi:16S rRNA (cytidine1402-2'-O)-methyltransferase
MQAATKGRLFLVPAPLDFGCATQSPLGETMPAGTLAVAAKLTHWI